MSLGERQKVLQLKKVIEYSSCLYFNPIKFLTSIVSDRVFSMVMTGLSNIHKQTGSAHSQSLTFDCYVTTCDVYVLMLLHRILRDARDILTS